MSVDDDLNVIASIEPITREDLIERIIRLLNTSPEKLMAILYRIDVSEKKITEIFDKTFPLEVPERIADAIIERQIQKAKTRNSEKAKWLKGEAAHDENENDSEEQS